MSQQSARRSEFNRTGKSATSESIRSATSTALFVRRNASTILPRQILVGEPDISGSVLLPFGSKYRVAEGNAERQTLLTGHTQQRGLAAVQIVAPRSISA